MTFFAIHPSRPLKLLSTTDLVQEIKRLEEAYAQAEQAAEAHAVIDQAMGAIVVLGQMPPEEAWRTLRDVSQRTNTKLRVVAEHVLSFAQGGTLPEAERVELHKAIARYAPRT